jgi:hypothetical protein
MSVEPVRIWASYPVRVFRCSEAVMLLLRSATNNENAHSSR